MQKPNQAFFIQIFENQEFPLHLKIILHYLCYQFLTLKPPYDVPIHNPARRYPKFLYGF